MESDESSMMEISRIIPSPSQAEARIHDNITNTVISNQAEAKTDYTKPLGEWVESEKRCMVEIPRIMPTPSQAEARIHENIADTGIQDQAEADGKNIPKSHPIEIEVYPRRVSECPLSSEKNKHNKKYHSRKLLQDALDNIHNTCEGVNTTKPNAIVLEENKHNKKYHSQKLLQDVNTIPSQAEALTHNTITVTQTTSQAEAHSIIREILEPILETIHYREQPNPTQLKPNPTRWVKPMKLLPPKTEDNF